MKNSKTVWKPDPKILQKMTIQKPYGPVFGRSLYLLPVKNINQCPSINLLYLTSYLMNACLLAILKLTLTELFWLGSCEVGAHCFILINRLTHNNTILIRLLSNIFDKKWLDMYSSVFVLSHFMLPCSLHNIDRSCLWYPSLLTQGFVHIKSI